MITFDRVTFTYQGADRPALHDVRLGIGEGEFALVTGPTGVGKSTLLSAVNGLVPHFTGGTLAGRVLVDGLDTAQAPPREFAATVGMVRQDPLSGFVTDTVEEELAYGMEQLGFAPARMRTRVEDTLDLLGIAELRARPLRTLSGGQQQRVAIGSVLAAGARVLVLDEPTSALDPTSAEEVLAALLRLVHDVGVTLLIAEHRLERVAEYADLVVSVDRSGAVRSGPPAELLSDSVIAPPVVELARVAGWSPPPLSVRNARRRAAELRALLASGPIPVPIPVPIPAPIPGQVAVEPATCAVAAGDGERPALSARDITVVYGQHVAVREVSLRLPPGEVAVLMGRNGSGKSSLLWALSGVGPKRSGRAAVNGRDIGGSDTLRQVRLVPQSAADLLYLDSVAAECAVADAESESAAGTCRALLHRMMPGVPDDRHPRDLSEGQRLGLVLAIQLTADPAVVLLDEPTRGLDYLVKRQLVEILRDAAAAGRAILVATHDVEFAAEVADRVLVMATGELISDGTPTQVLLASTSLTPQVARILSPQQWLTVTQVQRAMAGREPE